MFLKIIIYHLLILGQNINIYDNNKWITIDKNEIVDKITKPHIDEEYVMRNIIILSLKKIDS